MMLKYSYLCNLLLLSIFIILVKGSNEEPDLPDDSDIPVVEGFGETVTIPEENDVLILNDNNFHHVVGTKDVILVEFYAPWCGHCKSLEPEYAAAAKELKKDGIRIAKVDATVETEIAKEFEITGYPTLKLFKKGKFSEEFDDARTSTGIIEYMREHADPNYSPPPSSVVILTESNFFEFVKAEKLSLVEFYAPWCGHCKQLAPEYEGAAQDLKAFKIPLAKVDGTVEKSLTTEYNVKGYPKLLVFRSGQSYEYKGTRDRKGIVSYMEEQLKLPSIKIQSTKDAKNLFPKSDPWVFAFFDIKNKMYNEYISTANQMRGDSVFLHTFDSEVASKYGLSKNTINVLFPDIYQSKHEDEIKTFKEDEGSKSEMFSWISKNIVPAVGQRTKANIASKYSKRPLVVIYYDVNFDQHARATQFIRHKILPVANKHTDVVIAISNEEEFMDELKNLGLEDSGEDIHVAIYAEDNTKYRMKPEDISRVDLGDFVTDFKNGKLKPYLKSQAIPKRQEGPVRIIVADTIETEVLNSEKDVLIEFYAPWCGHCKKLEPVYKKLATYYATERPDLVIAKMDATVNDIHPKFKVHGFPTIFLIKASDKDNLIPFEGGERTLSSFKKFIEKHLPSNQSKDEL